MEEININKIERGIFLSIKEKIKDIADREVEKIIEKEVKKKKLFIRKLVSFLRSGKN